MKRLLLIVIVFEYFVNVSMIHLDVLVVFTSCLQTLYPVTVLKQLCFVQN